MKKRTQTQSIVALALCMVLAMPLTSLARQDGIWTDRKECIFGMPTMGMAVAKHEAGLINNILIAVFKKDRIDVTYKAIPFKRAQEELTAGTIDCSLDLNGYKRVGLQAKSTMVFYDLSVAYLRKSEWDGIKSLEGKRVGYLHGFALEDLLPVKFRPQMIYDLSSSYHMLDRRHVDYVLDDNLLLRDALYDSKLPAAGFAIAEIKSFEVRPVFADTPKGRRYLKIYDWRMREMIKDGELAEIFAAHGLGKAYMERIRKANGL